MIIVYWLNSSVSRDNKKNNNIIIISSSNNNKLKNKQITPANEKMLCIATMYLKLLGTTTNLGLIPGFLSASISGVESVSNKTVIVMFLKL